MISHKYNFIFIHIPKTGGNSIQTILAPFSDDRIHVRDGFYHDGVDRFAVKGRLTLNKHVDLAHYVRFVKVERFKVVTCCRHPVERLLSAYFSPSSWYVRQRDRTWRLQSPYWDRQRFLDTLPPRSADFLKIDGSFRKPDFLLRFDHLEGDFVHFLQAAAIPAPGALPKLNVSHGTSEALGIARADPIISEVARSRYREDFERFGFPLL